MHITFDILTWQIYITYLVMVVMVVVVCVVVDSWLLFAQLWRGPGYIGGDFGHIPYSLGPSLPEDHPGAWLDVLWGLDKPKVASGFVSSPQVVPIHGHNGCCLSCASAVYWVSVCVCVCACTWGRLVYPCRKYLTGNECLTKLRGSTKYMHDRAQHALDLTVATLQGLFYLLVLVHLQSMTLILQMTSTTWDVPYNKPDSLFYSDLQPSPSTYTVASQHSNKVFHTRVTAWRQQNSTKKKIIWFMC